MRFDVYCDESRPDLLSSNKSHANFMVIGGIWLRKDDRDAFKKAIHELRDKHKIGGEFKWQKVSPSRLEFYLELVDWFVSQGERLRFRCIAVEQGKVNLLHFHDNDQELGFYKFYYQMLHHWILDFNEYAIFCDFKQNRLRNRLHVLRRCLDLSNLSSSIDNVQSVRSDESVFIQMADVLTGISAARLNGNLHHGSAKERVVARLEAGIGRTIAPTSRCEQKFNVFQIHLQGGW